VALLTAARYPGYSRPLFDGFSPPQSSYRWVTPPNVYRSTNGRPLAANGQVSANAPGPTVVQSLDKQVRLTFAAGEHFPVASDTALAVTARPLDPLVVGPLPAGMFVDSNAYLVELTGLPSGQVVSAVPGPVTVALVAPTFGHLLLSWDGTAWHPLNAGVSTAHNIRTVTAFISGAGVFATARVTPFRIVQPKTNGWIVLVVGVSLVVLPVVLLLRPLRSTTGKQPDPQVVSAPTTKPPER
jgi:hypothetical protein